MPIQQRAIATRARIISAASEYFDTQGYRATTVSAVAERADCAVGALQFHFPTKAKLAGAVISEEHRIVMTEARSLLAQNNPSGVDDVVVISMRLAELIAESSTVRAGLRLLTESVNDLGLAASQPYLDWASYCARQLAKARDHGELVDDVDVQCLAEFVVSAFTGAQMMSAAVSGSKDLPERLMVMWPMFFSGITTHPYTRERISSAFAHYSGQATAESTEPGAETSMTTAGPF